MSSILITGGSGFFGTAFTKFLLTGDCPRIIVFSRSEHRQAEMANELSQFSSRLRFFVGDVRDKDRLRKAMQDVEIVVHAAALKRIEVGFYNPAEMVKTNILGSLNVVEAAHDAGVAKVVGISSDKAVSPVSPYGFSKAMMESLLLSSNNTRGDRGPIFSICRYGNVWNSTGSVVPTWRRMIKAGAIKVPVTDPDATRFFMRINQAVELVWDTIKTMKGGETAIPVLPAYRLGDLASAMGVKYEIKGLPDYEKKHETMGQYSVSEFARRMSIEELQRELACT